MDPKPSTSHDRAGAWCFVLVSCMAFWLFIALTIIGRYAPTPHERPQPHAAEQLSNSWDNG